MGTQDEEESPMLYETLGSMKEDIVGTVITNMKELGEKNDMNFDKII